MSAFGILSLLHALVQTPQPPVVEFPEAGLDDPAAYEGYSTRFFRDSSGNTLQIYIDARTGRVVHLWADAANESAAFTVRDTTGAPADVEWGAGTAVATARGDVRGLQHTLRSDLDALDVGWFLLGTMRQERDFQYSESHLRPYGEPRYLLPELTGFITSLGQLPRTARERHLGLLDARSTEELAARLEPQLVLEQDDSVWTLRVHGVTLDGENQLSLELRDDARESVPHLSGDVLSVRARGDAPLSFSVTVSTDAPALTPLPRDVLFNDAFKQYHARLSAASDSLRGSVPPQDARLLAFRRLDRQARGLELLSSQEKLMAGLPNFATYFGRDMMMAALMLEPIVSVDVQEHVIASVLRKLSPDGEVSHEEALGGQAIREHAAQYSELIRQWREAGARGDSVGAARALADAEDMLRDMQAVRENYRMVDDDFQLPVLAARYLSRPDVPAERKRRFLEAANAEGIARADLLLRNLRHVAERARAYVESPSATNLVGFLHRDTRGFEPGSWRDSRAGYGNGRFAMDVNVVWVPKALNAAQIILQAVADSGAAASRMADLPEFVRDSARLSAAIETWQGARRHFEVRFSPQQIRRAVDAMLDAWPGPESVYWRARMSASEAADDSLSFLAVALDSLGQPIPVVNTDPATDLFLEHEGASPATVRPMLDAILREYPVGLMIDSLGPVVANDAYASAEVQERFRADAYHSPRAVWGREVNLLFLGLIHQILALHDEAGRLRTDTGDARSYVGELRDALARTRDAVEASGLGHAELWSYRLVDGMLRPVRYGSSTDIQLWNVTDLAVDFLLAQLPPR